MNPCEEDPSMLPSNIEIYIIEFLSSVFNYVSLDIHKFNQIRFIFHLIGFGLFSINNL